MWEAVRVREQVRASTTQEGRERGLASVNPVRRQGDQGKPVEMPSMAHAMGVVQWPLKVEIPVVELMRDRDALSDEEILQRYGPGILKDILINIENWRDSNEIDPMTEEERETRVDTDTVSVSIIDTVMDSAQGSTTISPTNHTHEIEQKDKGLI